MTGKTVQGKDFIPQILAFSTNNISDPGVDLAGSNHLHYSPGVLVISIPCTSGIKPEWILYALEKGFDGVFIAADGEECACLPDCTDRTAGIVQKAQAFLQENNYDPQRLIMSAICSVCAEPFVKQVTEFSKNLKKLGPARKG